MQITVALDGSKVRNLTVSPGDEITINLTVYEHDGDTSSLAYTNPEIAVNDGNSYPVSTEFSVPLDVGRTPYRLTVEIDGDTTTVAYGYLQTDQPGSCSVVVCECIGGGSSSGGGSSYQPLNDNLTSISQLEDPDADRIMFWDDSEGEWSFLTLGTNLSITGDTLNASGGGGSGDVVGPASSANNRVAFFDGVTGKLLKDSGLTLSGSNTGDQTNITGNAGTATTLQTSRNIDGIAFNGSADITVIAPATVAASSKATPADADVLPIADSAASNVLKKLTWANIKATLKTYFDTLYLALVAPGASGNVLTSNGSAWTSAAPAGATVSALCVRREEAAGTNGGNITASTWTTLVLNTTVSNSITGASRSGNQVTLPAGTYVLDGWCPIGGVGAGKLRIQNITDTTTALTGFNFVGGGPGYGATIVGTFTLAASKVLEFQIWAPTAVGSSALGNGTSIGTDNEIFAGFTVMKVA